MSLRSLRSIVSGQPPAVAEKTLTVLEAAILMKEKGKGALLVVEASRLSGIFTERDALFRVIAAGRDPRHHAACRRHDPAASDNPSGRAVRQSAPRDAQARIPPSAGGRARQAARRRVRARRARRRPVRASCRARDSGETSGTDRGRGLRSGRDQARHAHWHARPLQSFDPVLDLPVGHRQAGPQPDVFGPGPDDETLDEATLLAQIPEDEPVARPVAPPDRLHAVNGADELVEVFGLDPVFDLDQDRPIVG